jgi:hypothetical protein
MGNVAMTPSDDPAAILRDHLELCSELHALLLEENRVLRTTGAAPTEDMLARKREFLPKLDASLEKLRAINAGGASLTREASSAVQEGRNRLMQVLMLDRENERLLLKAALPAPFKASLAPVAPGQVARAYARHAGKPPSGGTA